MGKTRLGSAIHNQQAANAFAKALIEDMRKEYTPKQNEYILYSAKDFPQLNLDHVGIGMNNIFNQLLKIHERVIIVGSDLPKISQAYILHTFQQLKKHPLIITPTIDKGYGLIGMNRYVDVFTQIQNFDSRTSGYNLVEETDLLAEQHNVLLYKQPVSYDIDYPFDVARTRRFILGQEKKFPQVFRVLKQFPELYNQSVSIIIPVYNERNIILNSLNQIKELHNGEAIDWIFVDGGSKDDTKKIIRNFIDTHGQYQIRLLSATGGRGGALAYRAKQAYGEILAFVHADTVIPKDFSERIQHALKNKPNVIGGAFTLEFDNSAWQYTGIAIYSKFRSKIFRIYHGDQAMFIKREALKKIGGVPNIPLMEDALLSKKMKKIGNTTLLKKKVTSSTRRFKKNGFFLSVFLYFFLKTAFFLGIPPKYLKKIYS